MEMLLIVKFTGCRFERIPRNKGRFGLLPHVTILYPFVAFPEWSAGVREAPETSLGRERQDSAVIWVTNSKETT